jgi:hypothetical protein
LLVEQAFQAAGAEPVSEPVVKPSGEGGRSVGAKAGAGGTDVSEAGASDGGTGGNAAAGEGGDAPLTTAGDGGALARGGAPASDAGRDSGEQAGNGGIAPTPPKVASQRRRGGCGVATNSEIDSSVWLLFALAACFGRARGAARRGATR